MGGHILLVASFPMCELNPKFCIPMLDFLLKLRPMEPLCTRCVPWRYHRQPKTQHILLVTMQTWSSSCMLFSVKAHPGAQANPPVDPGLFFIPDMLTLRVACGFLLYTSQICLPVPIPSDFAQPGMSSKHLPDDCEPPTRMEASWGRPCVT